MSEFGFGECGVSGGWCLSAHIGVGSVVVVFIDEGVELVLELVARSTFDARWLLVGVV